MIRIISRRARNNVPAISAVLWNTWFGMVQKMRNLPNQIVRRFLIDLKIRRTTLDNLSCLRLVIFDSVPRGPGWLSGCTLLSHKVQSAGSNSRKVNGFIHPGLPPLGNLDYGSYDGAERRKRLNWARGFIVAGGGHAPHLLRICPQW